MTTNLKDRFEEMIGKWDKLPFEESILPHVLAFIKQELELLAEEVESKSGMPKRTGLFTKQFTDGHDAALIVAAAIIRNRAKELE